ncbi:unnamed protein product, partial [Acanthocheilonema viteae]
VNRLTLKPEQSAQWQHQLFRLRPARHGGDAEERNVKGRTVVLTSKSHREKPCQREWVIRIPDRYVFDGEVARKTMELGEMNLEVELEDENQECIHH